VAVYDEKSAGKGEKLLCSGTRLESVRSTMKRGAKEKDGVGPLRNRISWYAFLGPKNKGPKRGGPRKSKGQRY